MFKRLLTTAKRPLVQDTALALVMLWTELGGLQAVNVPASVALVALLSSAMLPLRRRHPVVVLVVIGVFDTAGMAMEHSDTAVGPLFVALYSVGRYTSTLTSVVMTVLSIVIGLSTHAATFGDPGQAAMVITALNLALAVATGHIISLRRELTTRREQQIADEGFAVHAHIPLLEKT
ncbi:hypothetical protein [Sinosporangium siamense]|uniref:Two-component sensor histidine kinase n=1 Tax=Sinosporangium siamense TaxID=1367973 RepID=A0A919RJE2_9ACTN|nr:hypothetical protein [Sinosporangium siamense]GII94941.1 hypothetical protein Ssi02_51720 [Sinosporangium siamense]